MCKPVNKRKTSLLFQCPHYKKNLPNFQAIFRYQEEILQETLVIRLIMVFDQWWMQQGLDLKIITLKTVQVDDLMGYTQVLDTGETLKNICEKHGAGLASGDRNAVLRYIENHNKGKGKVAALEHFRRSLAGYCVATYVLGVVERQYNYYVINEDGRFFHKYFGEYIFGGLRRDKTMIAFTKEMESALIEKENKATDMNYFYNLCYSAIIVLRKNSHQLLNLISMMKVTNIPCFATEGALEFVKGQLNLDGNDADACQNVNLLDSVQTDHGSIVKRYLQKDYHRRRRSKRRGF